VWPFKRLTPWTRTRGANLQIGGDVLATHATCALNTHSPEVATTMVTATIRAWYLGRVGCESAPLSIDIGIVAVLLRK